MSVTISGVGLHITQAYPELFQPTYYPKPRKYATAANGTQITSYGECTVLLRLQHDITGQDYESIIPLQITGKGDTDHITLSYYASCRYFYPIFTQVNQTFRSVILSEFIEMFANVTPSTTTKVLTKHLSYNSDGTVLPTKPFELHSVHVLTDTFICHECKPSEQFDPSPQHIKTAFPIVYQHIPIDPLLSIKHMIQDRLIRPQRLHANTSLEVECKFMPTDELISRLSSTYTSTTKQFTDTYYDDPHFTLSCRDMWLRKREDVLELKYPHPHGHTGGTSHYLETTDQLKILQLLQKQHPVTTTNQSFHDVLSSSSISPHATILTSRQTFKDITVPSARHPRQHHTCHIDTDTATLQCSNTSSTYTIAEVELNSSASLDTPQVAITCLLYTSPSPRDRTRSRMPSSA